MRKFVGLCICSSSMRCCTIAPAVKDDLQPSWNAHNYSIRPCTSQFFPNVTSCFGFFERFFSFFQQRIFSEVENSAAQITDSFVNDCYEWVDKRWETTFVRFGKTYPANWALFHQHFLLQEGMLIDVSVSPLAHVLTLLSAMCYLQGCLLSNGVAFWSFFSSTCTRI